MPGIRLNVLSMAGYTPGEQPRDGEYIKLNTNENPYPPSPRVFEAIREALSGDRIRRYPEPLGDTFRTVAAKVFGVRPDQILIGNGSDDILTILTRTFVPEGGLIASPTPSYLLYKTLASIQGARFRTVPFTASWQLPDPWPVADADLTFIANPNSPSGTCIDPHAISQLAKRTARAVVLDEAYVDFTEKSGLPYAGSPNLILTRTLSKSYALAGIRFGFAIASPEVIRELVKVKDSYNCDVLSLTAATAAIQDREYLAETRMKIITTRERLTDSLHLLGFDVTPSQANFVWVRRSDRPVKAVYEALKARRILVRYMSYPEYGDGLRVTVGTDAEVDSLLRELTQILSV
ncbi:MAG TPA: histidinol-phosphate transaminase [Gemmataceae bacterium]|nr:histidinol-phosphate transaminase [Gemmataceae bacterium]